MLVHNNYEHTCKAHLHSYVYYMRICACISVAKCTIYNYVNSVHNPSCTYVCLLQLGLLDKGSNYALVLDKAQLPYLEVHTCNTLFVL